MNLQAVFHFSLYVLVALAGAMLAFGEETAWPSLLTVLFSGLALHFQNRSVWFKLPAIAGNLLGVVALGAAAWEFFGESQEARLLAVAHFLAYITWIVLLQAKGVRQYWWLCALSLLQVAVGSVLTNATGTYGLGLLAYLLLALWTLSVFTLYQGALEFGGLNDALSESPAGITAIGAVSGQQLSPSAASTTVPVEAFSLAASFQETFSAARRSTVRNAIQQDSPGRWIVPRFVVGVLGLSVAGLFLGLAMFLLVPRVWVGGGGVRYQGESKGAQAVVGFSGEVRLGQIGQILESTERVFRVQIVDIVSDGDYKPMTLEEFAAEFGLSDPLFRGAVLERYQSGRWKAGREETPTTIHPYPRKGRFIRQDYTLDLVGTEVLFAMRPISSARLDAPFGPMNFIPETGVFPGSIEGRDPIKYFVYSRRRQDGPAPPWQNEFGEMRGSGFMPANLVTRYLEPATGLDQLGELARRIADQELQSNRSIGGPDVSPERRKAVALTSYLRDEENFDYSLNMAVEDPSRDPVEEFLFVRKKGHCEYFASALALMLRSVEIPARLVTGFKGADHHKASGHNADSYYEVQQRHGHVWVEAWVDNQWIVLDPTPEARDTAVREMASRSGFWKNARDSIQSMWSTYVVSLSLSRQQEALYDPLHGSVSSGLGTVSSLIRRAASGVDWVKGALTTPEQFFSPRGAALGLALLGSSWAIVSLLRRGRQRGRRRSLAVHRPGWMRRVAAWLAMRLTGRAPDPARMIVEFYEQFQALASAAGFARDENQTQREFARQFEEALGNQLAQADLRRFPSELAELFYRVRFGAGRLDALEAGDIEQRLTRLAVCLRA